jgi:anti-sigma factor RsiW
MNPPAVMNDAMFEELLALRHKRPLTPDEQARLDQWLAAHPADRARWHTEAALARALGRLSGPPAASNFMARVWQDIEAAERQAESARPPRWSFWPGLRLPGLETVFSVLAVLFLFGIGSHYRHATRREPTQVARGIERVTAFAGVPSVALLKDFEAIRRLNSVSADVELLAALEGDR